MHWLQALHLSTAAGLRGAGPEDALVFRALPTAAASAWHVHGLRWRVAPCHTMRLPLGAAPSCAADMSVHDTLHITG